MQAKTRSLAEHLLALKTPLGALLSRVDRLAKADRTLRETLDASLSERFRLANVRDNTAILHADSAATATILRYRQQDILRILQTHAEIECERIKVALDPSLLKI